MPRGGQPMGNAELMHDHGQVWAGKSQVPAGPQEACCGVQGAQRTQGEHPVPKREAVVPHQTLRVVHGWLRCRSLPQNNCFAPLAVFFHLFFCLFEQLLIFFIS